LCGAFFLHEGASDWRSSFSSFTSTGGSYGSAGRPHLRFTTMHAVFSSSTPEAVSGWYYPAN